MARNTRRSNGMKKLQPAVQTMFFNTESTESGTNQTKTSFIDLSQCACLLNRRFYRQGINWAVSRIQIFSSVSGSITVSKLPNTWVMSNAWEKGFRAWQQMNDDALEEAPSTKPRFLDFKIYADADHHEAGFGNNLLPKSIKDATTFPQALPGEWVASSIKIPYTDNDPGNIADREILAVGGNYQGAGDSGKNSVSLIEGYANSRALPSIKDPNTPADMADADGVSPENWISALFNEGTNQDDRVLNDMFDDNNRAPYPFEGDTINTDTMYPGGPNQLEGLELHGYGQITGTTIGGQTQLKGGMFPCGLIRIDHTTASEAANLAVIVDLVPGDHRGYLCEPMTDM